MPGASGGGGSGELRDQAQGCELGLKLGPEVGTLQTALSRNPHDAS